MNKTLTYTGFGAAALLMVLAFVTAKTYTQLAIAVILYPLLAYFALRILPRRKGNAPVIAIQMPARPAPRSEQRAANSKLAQVEVSDIDKRTFLKLIGTAGLSFFIFSILGRRVESLLFGTAPGISPVPTAPGGQTAASAAEDGYKISEIEDDVISYYGFTGDKGAWRIMRVDTETNSFRYASGDSGFSRAWANRKKLQYDYFHKL